MAENEKKTWSQETLEAVEKLYRNISIVRTDWIRKKDGFKKLPHL